MRKTPVYTSKLTIGDLDCGLLSGELWLNASLIKLMRLEIFVIDRFRVKWNVRRSSFGLLFDQLMLLSLKLSKRGVLHWGSGGKRLCLWGQVLQMSGIDQEGTNLRGRVGQRSLIPSACSGQVKCAVVGSVDRSISSANSSSTIVQQMEKLR